MSRGPTEQVATLPFCLLSIVYLQQRSTACGILPRCSFLPKAPPAGGYSLLPGLRAKGYRFGPTGLRPFPIEEESKPAMKLHHVIEAQQFNPASLLHLFDTAQYMEQVVAHGGTTEFQKRIMAALFYEPSTRTRFSFETAMHRLGGHREQGARVTNALLWGPGAQSQYPHTGRA